MHNAITYSFHVGHGSLEDHRCFKQMIYSVTTLRKFNKTIPVNVYIAPVEVVPNLSKYDYLGINFIPFNNTPDNYGTDWYKTWLDLGYAEFLYHRWVNAYRSLREFKYDNVLYLDTDTVFHKDPELLFNKYGNTEYVWAREDNSYGIMNKLGITDGMNDGQFIISKNILKHEKESLENLRKYTNITLENMEGFLTGEEHLSLHWLCVQYAMFNYFSKIGVPIKYFDHSEVMLHIEPEHNDNINLILHHYYNGNSYKFIPPEFW